VRVELVEFLVCAAIPLGIGWLLVDHVMDARRSAERRARGRDRHPE